MENRSSRAWHRTLFSMGFTSSTRPNALVNLFTKGAVSRPSDAKAVRFFQEKRVYASHHGGNLP